MIVDTSVLVAILKNEEGFEELVDKASSAGISRFISAASYLEAGIVVDGNRDTILSSRLDALIEELDIEIAPVTETQARRARQAYRDFGKGSGHAAQLNFGDCFAYALATDLNQPLLYKGNDFTLTGIRRA
jgi:ribonuclease VapC